MKKRNEVIKWIKQNDLTEMTMQVFPPDGWTWIKDNETKTFILVNPETNETVSRKDVTDE